MTTQLYNPNLPATAGQAHDKLENRIKELEQELADGIGRFRAGQNDFFLQRAQDALNAELALARASLARVEATWDWQQTLRARRDWDAAAGEREIARRRQERIEHETEEYNKSVAQAESIHNWREVGIHSILEKLQLSKPFFEEIDRRRSGTDEADMLERGIREDSDILVQTAAEAGITLEVLRKAVQTNIDTLRNEHGAFSLSVQNERTGQWFVLAREADGFLWVDRDNKRNITRNIE